MLAFLQNAWNPAQNPPPPLPITTRVFAWGRSETTWY
jgi:hypothetical protein